MTDTLELCCDIPRKNEKGETDQIPVKKKEERKESGPGKTRERKREREREIH